MAAKKIVAIVLPAYIHLSLWPILTAFLLYVKVTTSILKTFGNEKISHSEV